MVTTAIQIDELPAGVRLMVDDPVAAIRASVDPRVDLTMVNPAFGVITSDPNDVHAGAMLALDAGAAAVERGAVVYPAFTPCNTAPKRPWGCQP